MADKENIVETIKKHVLTGVSYMLPLIVAAGICMALGQVVGRLMGGNLIEVKGSLPFILNQIGIYGLAYLIVPVICAFIAFSISDRPGIAPGLIIGFICTQIQAGFIGGMIGGFFVGYVVNAIKKYVRVPAVAQGLMPIMIIPVLSTVICGLSMYYIIGEPIIWLQTSLIAMLKGMESGSKFAMGAILGAMATFDFGGPVNKTMSLFADGLLVDGVYGPEAVKFVGSMIPPFGIAISYFLTKNKYTKAEKEALKAAVPMGFCMITEGVIPIAARDLFRVVASCVVGSAIAGGLLMVWGVESPVPHGGMFVVPLFKGAGLFCAALLLGSVICGTMLSLLKKKVTEADESFDDNAVIVKDEDINFTLE